MKAVLEKGQQGNKFRDNYSDPSEKWQSPEVR